LGCNIKSGAAAPHSKNVQKKSGGRIQTAALKLWILPEEEF